ncbi:MAG TPA: 3-phosphoshikimate 1-carboxyvinyltransferase, partial [Ferruginibacter sp.]|nr:3-phosphoshikimate 1-carboxyvinyltransferase [Ferruginibacter sp.]
MIATIHPSSIHGLITAAASKSAMQRACALALLHRGETIIQNPGRSNDDLAALDIIRKLGAETEIKDEALRIKNDGECRFAGTIHCGESGLGIRMFTPIAALSGSEVIIEGSGSLRNRPMHFFDEILPQLGVQVESNKGYLPIKIKGPLRPADCTIDGSLSSQFLTGLLMAFGKAAKEPVVITVTNLKSKPYIDLTL